jgi:ABC-type multidrug transport system fused ATPase/permease subunit
MRWLWPRLRSYRWIALGALVALILQGLLQTYPIELLRQSLKALNPKALALNYHQVLMIALWYICAVLAAGLNLLANYWSARFGTGMGADLRQQLHDHIQRLSLDFFEDRQSGDLLNRSMGDVTELKSYLVSPITWVGESLFTFLFAFYFLYRIDARLTLWCIPVGGLLIIAMYFVGRLIRPVFRRFREVSSDIFSQFSENVAGIREVQAFTRESSQSARYEGSNQQLRRLEVKTAVIGQLLDTAFMVIFPLAGVIVLWQGGLDVQTGKIKLEDLFAFFYYSQMLVRPLRGMAGNYAALQRALVSADRVMEVMTTTPRVEESADAISIPFSKGEVVGEGVSFSYDGRSPALDNVSFHVQPGQRIALVGPSGAGKTTLMKLLLRYYDPQQGRILIDGTDIREVTLESLRAHMGVVFQDPFLFNGTLADNIAFGRAEANAQEIAEAARAADLEEFIKDLPDGYDTLVGDRGVKLSGGQRSRLAIARAMLRNPRILIMDEATASVDTEAEKRIQDALDHLIADRTCFIIAHRLSTVIKADQILVLAQGKLVESGKHAELISKDGLYASLYKAQFAAQEGA